MGRTGGAEGGDAAPRLRRDTAGAAVRDDALDGAHYANIARAAAQVPAHENADLTLVRLGKAQHRVPRGDQHAGGAEAALQRVLAGERVSKLNRHFVMQAFDRRDYSAVARDGIGDAGARRRPVDQNGAGAAHPVLAAEMSAGEIAVLTDEIREMRTRLDLGLDRAAVYSHGNAGHADDVRATARLSAATCIWRSIGSARPRRRRRSSARLASKLPARSAP